MKHALYVLIFKKLDCHIGRWFLKLDSEQLILMKHFTQTGITSILIGLSSVAGTSVLHSAVVIKPIPWNQPLASQQTSTADLDGDGNFDLSTTFFGGSIPFLCDRSVGLGTRAYMMLAFTVGSAAVSNGPQSNLLLGSPSVQGVWPATAAAYAGGFQVQTVITYYLGSQNRNSPVLEWPSYIGDRNCSTPPALEIFTPVALRAPSGGYFYGWINYANDTYALNNIPNQLIRLGTTEVIPEPATSAVMLVGLGVVTWHRKRA